MLFILIISIIISQVSSFVHLKIKDNRLQPMRENFFLDIAEDPAINTPKQILGEVAYKSFVEEYNPNALLIGGPKYDVVERVRQLKLLKLTAESGLIEALEAKGLTLSKIEALLPLIDNLGLLPLLTKNKDLVLTAAPLIIEPAPAIIPIAVSLLKTSPVTFYAVGLSLVGLGAYEATDNLLIGAPFILTGLSVTIIGVALSTVSNFLGGSVPVVNSAVTPVATEKVKSSRPVVTSKTPVIQTKVTTSSASNLNGKRKTVKINSR